MQEKTSKTDEENKNPFTCYYAQLLHQGNMLQDLVRTGTYQQAILENRSNFEGKVVLDVGTGTGILSFFAAQAGARKVYAVEASQSAEYAQLLADHNGFSGIVEVVQGKLEDITLPEKVDVIISEPIGFLLVHERMLESYVVARDKFLKPSGLMMPTTGSIIFSPMTDDALYKDQLAKAALWENPSFYGIDLTPLVERARLENFSQPIVGFFPSSNLISSSRTVHCIDFGTVTTDELTNFEIAYRFPIDRTAIMHGFGCWFDLGFLGQDNHVVLSTSPDHPGTHWYQCRLLLADPIAVNRGQVVAGRMVFVANDRFSYDIEITACIEGTHISTTSTVHLHDQAYQYLQTGPTTAEGF
mmetsp:Transcript_10391/g.15797  ORF Transcript_10391/g.15797 Transcript_10391/m.15797 type:complete len:357 (+) Transcript_10391:41-1111(+)